MNNIDMNSRSVTDIPADMFANTPQSSPEGTMLLYMSDMNMSTCDAKIVDIQKREGGKIELYLDQTVFYPQGGGQPWDTGIIETMPLSGARFYVSEVRYINGRVMHVVEISEIGKGEEKLEDVGGLADKDCDMTDQHSHNTGLLNISIGDTVRCVVDKDKRILYSRIHSAGHIMDMALKEIGLHWKPIKGYHFPNGPYVEYLVDTLPTDIDLLKQQLEQMCADIISRDIQTTITFEEIGDRCTSGPGGKPLRTVWYGDFGIQCGGTHVGRLGEIGALCIRKIKKEGNSVRVGYQVR